MSRTIRKSVLGTALVVLALLATACDDDLAQQAEDFELDDADGANGDADADADGADADDDGDAGDDEAAEEPEGEPEPDDVNLSWATSDVGSAGHTALVNLASVLNDSWDGYFIDVLPTAGAVQSVIGYAVGDYDGNYGADIAFIELAEDAGRFEGFSDDAERMPVQSFWAYPMETGLAIHGSATEEITSWGDLAGQSTYTGPAPWDVRLNLERALEALDVGHNYVEVDNSVVGSELDGGNLAGMIAYTAAEANPPAWIIEAELQTDMQILNPTDDEIAQLADAGLDVVEIDTGVFQTDQDVDTALFVPFFYGFHVGMEISEDDVYDMLTVVAERADELVALDPSYSVLADDPAELQRRGVEATDGAVEVHPGLARWMQEQGVWDDAWDDWIATE